MTDADVKVKNWAPIVGRWSFHAEAVQYHGPQPQIPGKYGICLADMDLTEGCISACVRVSPATEGRLLFGYRSPTQRYIMAGMGGWTHAYSIGEFEPGTGWRGLAVAGSDENLSAERPYRMSVAISGQRIQLTVDNVQVLEHVLDKPLVGRQMGLFAWGEQTVEFSNIWVRGNAGTVFVVMKFSEPYTQLYEEVIRQVACQEFGLRVYKADEVFGPGIILKDIIQGIIDATVVVVEITPDKEAENVFYELGYAHALEKPTILMAEHGRRLPFDISGYRVVFYENTIAGKNQVQDGFRKHLKAILGKQEAQRPPAT